MNWKVNDLVTVRHDREYWTDCETGKLVINWRFEDPCREHFGGDHAYPDPTPLFIRPSGGENSRRIPKRWWDKVKSMNSSAIWKNMRRNDGGWLNAAGNPEWRAGSIIPDPPDPYPRPESITSYGNISRVLDRRNGATRVDAYRFSDPVPDVLDPYKICNLYAIQPDGTMYDMGWTFPLLVAEEAWIPDYKLRKYEKPIMTVTKAWGVDIHPKYQSIYKDDDIDEGFDIKFVIQKGFDGIYDFTDPNNDNYYSYWKPQYDSIQHFAVKLVYGWYQTEQKGIPQAKLAVKMAKSGLYDGVVCDYEQYDNVIDYNSALEFKAYFEYFWANSDKKLLAYINGATLSELRLYLGSWVDKLDIWYAGGKYYNVDITQPLSDSELPPFEGYTIWQVSTRNTRADELDFGTNETSAIDLDVFNGTIEEMVAFFTASDTNPPVEDFTFETGYNRALADIRKYSRSIKKVIE